MKVLLYSHYFYPSVGGVETVSLTLAKGLVNNGIECKVVTRTSDVGDIKLPLEVIRNPKKKQQISLVRWADIILFNGASLALQPWTILLRKPFIWIHVGYQVSCIDGLGWVDGMRAPIMPLDSLKYHIQIKGWKWGLTEGCKLIAKRFIAKKMVTKNIAITKWMEQIQHLPRQVQIYNPFPLDHFLAANAIEEEFDFMYVGRIVSEKGVSTLLNAFSQLLLFYNPVINLLIVGDGNWRAKMENLAQELNITHAVTFAGKKTGKDLVVWVSKARIAVIPSEWLEPMGGVALEMMAAGKNLIVSEYGGLKECVGDAGLTFPNGDVDALATCMKQLLVDKALQNRQKEMAKKQLQKFEPELLIQKYIGLFEQLLKQ